MSPESILSSRPLLHKFANEDVSLGAWFIGLDVEHIDDREMCCGSETGQFLQLFCIPCTISEDDDQATKITLFQIASGRHRQGTSASHPSTGGAAGFATQSKG
jgi:hypothetical protein